MMSRKYLLSLAGVTLVLVIAAIMVQWLAPMRYVVAMLWLPVYFAVVSMVQHGLIVRAMQRSPKAFVQIFLATTVGVLFVHLAVMLLVLLTNTAQAKPFLLAFSIGYVVYLAFETIAIVKVVDNEKRQRNGEQR